MASVSNFSYQRLRNDQEFKEVGEEMRKLRKMKGWSRCTRKYSSLRKRPKVRIAGLMRRVWFLRSSTRFFTRLRVYVEMALKKLKDGQAHMGDLFAGNYLFMQPNPAVAFTKPHTRAPNNSNENIL